jgi:hypothetical protein
MMAASLFCGRKPIIQSASVRRLRTHQKHQQEVRLSVHLN